MAETLVERSCRHNREQKAAHQKRSYDLIDKGLRLEWGWFYWWQHEQETSTGRD